MYPSRWLGIRHLRWLILAWTFSRWWNHTGRYLWLAPNPSDATYLEAVWKGEA